MNSISIIDSPQLPLPILWCPKFECWVQVISKQRTLGYDVVHVLMPNGELRSLPISALSEIDTVSIESLWDGSLRLLSRARLWEALSCDVPIAPLLSRAIPLPHQFRVLRRALTLDEKGRNSVRLLLADEVGLGKTVSAGLIHQELKIRGLANRTLIVTPKSLMLQWVSEMDVHFNERFAVVEPGNLSSSDSENGWGRYRQAIVSIDSVKPLNDRAGWTSQRIDNYNLARFHDLVSAGWDLVIFDEAHKVAGSADDVARHELAKALARVCPHVLLLSATPHSGHSDAFARLLSLLDPNLFGPGIPLDKEQLRSFMFRTDKRTATDGTGKPLFAPRQTQLLVVPFEAKHELQRELYNSISQYVLENYGHAENSKGSRLLLILLQRLASSSTSAILNFLERRHETLFLKSQTFEENNANGELSLNFIDSSAEEEWLDEESETQAATLVRIQPTANAEFAKEMQAVNTLLALARATAISGPDARTEALLQTMLDLASQDNEPDKKFLVFTEWTSTQQMLRDFLTLRGYTVVLLNGSMSITERKAAQETFRNDVQVLISTDAGGEGLNLQFAHVVFNYDLPWNPMRLEQRIGRVDRIGQKKPVKAFNLALENSVEARLYQVLNEKLTRILEEFGVDKTSDVLDSREAADTFDSLAKAALLNPQTFESQADELLVAVRRAAEEGSEVRKLGETFTGNQISPTLPMMAWLETAQLRSEADATSFGQYITNLSPIFLPGVPVTTISLDVGFEIQAWFSLWRIGVSNAVSESNSPSIPTISRLIPICMSDAGQSFVRSARQIWDALCHPQTKIEVDATTDSYPYEDILKLAEDQAQPIFEELSDRAQQRANWRKEWLQSSHMARQLALQEIRSSQIRATRDEVLRTDFRNKMKELENGKDTLPIFECLFLSRVTCR